MEIKSEFFEVMTLATAYIIHETQRIDIILGNGEVDGGSHGMGVDKKKSPGRRDCLTDSANI